MLAHQNAAADLAGTWTGKFGIANTAEKEEAACLILKQTVTELSGSVGPNAERQQAINKGKVTTTAKGTPRGETYPDNKITAELQRAK